MSVDEETTVARTKNEQRAKEMFTSTHKRDNSSRYIVKIPLKENVIPLGFCSAKLKWIPNNEIFKEYFIHHQKTNTYPNFSSYV